MSVRFYADEFRVAIYEEAPGGGDPLNPNALMNRPILDPMGWLANLKFHSDLNYYGIAAKNLNIPITHPLVPTVTRTAGGTGAEYNGVVSLYGQGVKRTWPLLTHGLGYVPRFFAIYDGKLLPQGIPVQSEAGDRARFVTAYATTTEIRLYELGWSGTANLAAATRTYQVIAFRTPAKNPALKMLNIEPGSVVFGQGKFQFTEPHLRAVGAGDSPFAMARGVTAAIRDGGLRAYYPNGGAVDFNGFGGSLPAPDFINVAAGV